MGAIKDRITVGFWRFWAWAGVAVAAAFLVGSCGKDPQSARPPSEVKVALVRQMDVPVYGQWIGTLDGLVNAQIRAQVLGYLYTQDYVEGAFVHKGNVLFHIDPRTFQAAVNQAQANLARDTAQSEYDDVETNRVAKLLSLGASTQDEYDTARTASAAALATVHADEAALETAKLQLGYCTITSPVDGIAGLAAAQVGDLVGPTGPVLTTVSTVDPIKAVFTISEQEYLEYARDSGAGNGSVPEEKWELELVLANGEVYPYKGKCIASQRQVDIQTGALQLEGEFPNPGNILRPGQFARVRARTGLLEGALLVPQRAVTNIQGMYQVAVVDSVDRVHVRTVEMGDRFGTDWTVAKGLNPGDRVIVEGAQKVREGDLVYPKPFTED